MVERRSDEVVLKLINELFCDLLSSGDFRWDGWRKAGLGMRELIKWVNSGHGFSDDDEAGAEVIGALLADRNFNLQSRSAISWAFRWAAYGFPVLSVAADVAAAMALTDGDVSDESSIAAPWPHFVLRIVGAPPIRGSFGSVKVMRVSRIDDELPRWDICAGELPGLGFSGLSSVAGEFPDTERGRSLAAMASLVFGTMKLVENAGVKFVNSGKKRTKYGGRSADFFCRKYKLGKPVVIRSKGHSFSKEVARQISGERSRKSRWLVRGHWRNQAHGEGRSDHKRIWIQPFWKGPAAAPVLIRNHELKA